MKIYKLSTFGVTAVMATLLLFSVNDSFAEKNKDEAKPMKPELAAKKEMVRKQHEQRVTDTQRKTAAGSLKAERAKVYKAKQQVKQSKPESSEEK